MADAATPMIAQYLALKAEAADALLFYRMGDFYELFFNDARIAAAALGIALTRRGRHAGEDIAMCGVPVVSADAYLVRLVRAGHRVAVAEQIEPPAAARKAGRPVERAIVRVVSAATLTEEALLEAGVNNWLLVIVPEGERSGLAWADVSTGRFVVSVTARAAETRARLAPAEVVVPEASKIPDAVAFPAVHFDLRGCEQRLRATYGVATLDAFGMFDPLELRAAGALVAYLEHVGRGTCPRLDPPVREGDTGLLAIDAATRASLGLGRDGLLGAIDRTRSAPGERLLADDLAAPLTDAAAITARHEAVAWALGDARLRARLRERIGATPDFARALGRIGAGRGRPRDLALIGEGLASARAIAALANGAAESPPLFAAAFAGLDDHAATLGALGEALAPAPSGDLDTGGYIAAGFDATLDVLRETASGARARIAALEAEYRAASGVSGLRIRHNGVLGWHVDAPARAEAALRAAGYRHRQTLAGQVRFASEALDALAAEIAEAGEAAQILERAHFDALVLRVMGEATRIAATANALARIDVTVALAELAATERWTRPIIEDSAAFDIERGRHPVVEAALASAKKPFVANDCDLGDKPVWLVTGPNMGGKSTFLRQNALIVILAQMGSFVPARAARIGVVDRLFSRVGASDDLASGRSTFMVEMVETAAILRQATARSLVILDEVGRGTSTYDGLAIAWSVLEWIHDRLGCRCLFATHYHELTRLAERLDGLHLANLRAREWKGELVFLHEVATGAADRSYGLAVARLAGVPDPVIARAKAVLARLKAGRVPLAELPLFAGADAAPEPGLPAQSAMILDRLRALDPDALSPREAHALLSELAVLAAQDQPVTISRT